MINLIKAFINQLRPHPQKTTFQFVFSHNPENIQTVTYDYHTMMIDMTTNGILPNSLVFGMDNILIPTDNSEYVNDVLDHIISKNLINKYEYNKVILDDPFVKLNNILSDLEWKIQYLGYPKWVTIYKYINGIVASAVTYPLMINIKEYDDCVSNGHMIQTDVYINQSDILSFYKTY